MISSGFNIGFDIVSAAIDISSDACATAASSCAVRLSNLPPSAHFAVIFDVCFPSETTSSRMFSVLSDATGELGSNGLFIISYIVFK